MTTALRWFGRFLILLLLSLSAGVVLFRFRPTDNSGCIYFCGGFPHHGTEDHYILLDYGDGEMSLEYTPIHAYFKPEIQRTRYLGPNRSPGVIDNWTPAEIYPVESHFWWGQIPQPRFKFQLHDDNAIFSPSVTAPIWCWSASLALPGILYFLRLQTGSWRARRRQLKKICVQCGYDLRATPLRCPECNTSVAAQPSLSRRLNFAAGPLGMAGAVLLLLCIADYGDPFLLRKVNFDRWTLPTPQEYASIAARYQPIVQAIYDYRAQHLMLPADVYDLTPRYLAEHPENTRIWESELSAPCGFEYFHGLQWGSIEAETLIYSFDPAHEGWRCEGDLANERLPLPHLSATRPTNSAPDAIEMRLADLDRKIAKSYGKYNDHDNTCAKISLLINQGRIPEALRVAQDAANASTDWWFPQMVLARYAPREGADAAAERFSRWVDKNNTFYNCWCLATIYRDRQRDPDAFATLSRAATAPQNPGPSDVDEYWSFLNFRSDAAIYAYQKHQYQLVIDLCNSVAPFKGPDECLYALRSAAELSLGQFAVAQSDANLAVQSSWADRVPNRDKLLAAANAKDASFVFEYPAMDFHWKLICDPGREEYEERH